MLTATTLSVHWHDENKPIYSVLIQPKQPKLATRLATAGGDNNVRLWHILYEEDIIKTVAYVTTLKKHAQAVNVVRFDPSGHLLASAGDDGTLLVWLRLVGEPLEGPPVEDEKWVVKKAFRSAATDIYDIAWSPDSRYVAAGSMDNVTRVYLVADGGCVCELVEHSLHVQGVAWDPLNEYLATQSADRSVNLYRIHGEEFRIYHRITKGFTGRPEKTCASEKSDNNKSIDMLQNDLKPKQSEHGSTAKSNVSEYSKAASLEDGDKTPLGPPKALPIQTQMNPPALPHRLPILSPHRRLPLPAVRAPLFQAEQASRFFRRLCFSPDGSLLFAPTGHVKSGNNTINTVFVFSRAGLAHSPIYHLPGLSKPAIAVSCLPQRYPRKPGPSLVDLPYRLIYAVASADQIAVYDTQELEPLGVVKNLHYDALTDIAWTSDGKGFIVSSVEGNCLVVNLGEEKEDIPKEKNEKINQDKGEIQENDAKRRKLDS